MQLKCETLSVLLACNAVLAAVSGDLEIAWGLHALLQRQERSAELLASPCRSSMQT